MKAIAKATKRYRNVRGACYLTHGDDSYDKRGLNKARRNLDRAIIREWNEPASEPAPAPTGPITFRLVITTQVYENYGAHAWSGEGECPQYWKAKGGNEYQIALGTANDVIALGHAGLCELVRKHSDKTTQCNEYWDEYVIGWQVVPSNEETFEERDLREMVEWGMIDEETRQRRIAQLLLT